MDTVYINLLIQNEKIDYIWSHYQQGGLLNLILIFTYYHISCSIQYNANANQ
jgi:hypothetical protein